MLRHVDDFIWCVISEFGMVEIHIGANFLHVISRIKEDVGQLRLHHLYCYIGITVRPKLHLVSSDMKKMLALEVAKILDVLIFF